MELQFFEDVAWLYRARFMNGLKAYADDPSMVSGLANFLWGYAYERQGRAPNYPHAAYAAVIETGVKDGAATWAKYQELLTGNKLNPMLDPLYHSGDDECPCAVCWSSALDTDLVSWSATSLKAGRISETYWMLQGIRGVGPKIASFFLRDVADWYDIQVLRDRQLLQPIDVWVRRIVIRMSGGSPNDSEVADWIVANAERPERVNQGMWYFASQVAGSDFLLSRALRDSAYAGRLVEEHASTLRGAAEAWASLGTATGSQRGDRRHKEGPVL